MNQFKMGGKVVFVPNFVAVLCSVFVTQ